MGKIEILFKEYDALRAELRDRYTGTNQLIAIGAAGLGWIVSQASWTPKLAVGLAVLAAIIISTVRVNYVETVKLATRLREIERKINKLAGDDDLLCWENTSAGGVTGMWWPRFRKPN